MRVKAATAFAALILVACSPAASTNPAGGSTPTGSSGLTNTKAADLRTHLDLLLGEQVLIFAKETSAAAFETDEYPGYVALLAANASDLEDLVRLAFGNTTAGELATAWQAQNHDLVEYSLGLVTHKQSQADSAAADLGTSFVAPFSRLISSLTKLTADEIARLAIQQLGETETVIADIVNQSFARVYLDLHAAYAVTARLGDLLAGRIAQLFPDKFPGDPTIQAVSRRVGVSTALLEHSYLATMTTEATIRGRTADRIAATAALTVNATALSAIFSSLFGAAAKPGFDQAWAARDGALIDYASGSGTTARDALLQAFVSRFAQLAGVSPGVVGDQAAATLAVIDEQRAAAFTTLAADDRTAAVEMEPIADQMAAAPSVQG